MGRRKPSYSTPVDMAPKEDLSVLREPLSLGCEGVIQLVKCMQSGTTEIRNLLQRECNVILECKICCALFRGLPNFIAHKRVYCKELQQNTRLGLAPGEAAETVIVQPQSPGIEPDPTSGDVHSDPDEDEEDDDADDDGGQLDHSNADTDRSPLGSNLGGGLTGDSCSDTVDSNTFDLKDKQPDLTNNSEQDSILESEPSTSVLEQMLEGRFLGSSSAYKFYTEVVEKTLEKQETKKTSLIQLESLPGTSKAMQQTFKPQAQFSDLSQQEGSLKDTIDSSQPTDGQSEMDAAEVVLIEPKEATGHLRMSLRARSQGGVATPIALRLQQREDCDIKTLTCLLCDMQYSSMKTLHFHMVSLHSEKRTFHPCPICRITFAQPWGVARHLMKHHKKTKEEVDRMRDTLKRLSFTKSVDEITGEKIASSESVNRKGVGSKSSAALNTFKCWNCNKGFERKWFLEKHLLTCTSGKSRAATRHSLKKRESGQVEGNTQAGFEFSLQKCKQCGKAFGKKSLLTKHLDVCNGEEDEDCDSNFSAPESSDKLSVTSEMSVGTDNLDMESTLSDTSTSTSLSKHSGSTLTASKQSQSKAKQLSMWKSSGGIKVTLSSEDLKKVEAMINEDTVTCLRCRRRYGSISNLHRHAVRHLGWRRYKCKLCRFTAYNRSECKSHLGRVHTVKDKSKYDGYIVDLKDRMELPRNAMPRVEMQYTRHSKVAKDASLAPSTSSQIQSTGYNISTRKNPRTFDLKPVKRVEPMQVLCTRSGMYRKPTFEELVGRASKSPDSGPTVSDHEKDKDTKRGSRKRKQTTDKIKRGRAEESDKQQEELQEDSDCDSSEPTALSVSLSVETDAPTVMAPRAEQTAVHQLENEHGYNSPATSEKPQPVKKVEPSASKPTPAVQRGHSSKLSDHAVRKAAFGSGKIAPLSSGSPLRPRILRRSSLPRKPTPHPPRPLQQGSADIKDIVILQPGVQPTGNLVSIVQPPQTQSLRQGLVATTMNPARSASLQPSYNIESGHNINLPTQFNIQHVGSTITPTTTGRDSPESSKLIYRYIFVSNSGPSDSVNVNSAINTMARTESRVLSKEMEISSSSVAADSKFTKDGAAATQNQASFVHTLSSENVITDSQLFPLPQDSQAMSLENIEAVGSTLPKEIFAADQTPPVLDRFVEQRNSHDMPASLNSCLAPEIESNLLAEPLAIEQEQGTSYGSSNEGTLSGVPADNSQASENSTFLSKEQLHSYQGSYSPISELDNSNLMSKLEAEHLPQVQTPESESAVAQTKFVEEAELMDTTMTTPTSSQNISNTLDAKDPIEFELGSLKSIIDSDVQDSVQIVQTTTEGPPGDMTMVSMGIGEDRPGGADIDAGRTEPTVQAQEPLTTDDHALTTTDNPCS